MLGLGIGLNKSSFIKNNNFVSTWKTDNAGTSNNDQITIPVYNGGTYNCVVHWGDGTSNTITTWNDAAWTHTYAGGAGTYEVTIIGTLNGFRFNNGGDKLKLLEISNAGVNFRVGNLGNYFYGCSNLTKVDNLITTGMTNFSGFFKNCTSFNGSVSNFDTSSVTTISDMFYNCFAFNQSVSSFDTSLVTNMGAMFYSCFAFNQSLSSFDTSLVTTMYYMFYRCFAFNQSVSNFDTSSVTTMGAMFYGCSNFNQNISSFDISSITNMADMLTNANAWSTANYDAFLISASGQTVQIGVSFKCSSTYTGGGAAEAARTDLVNNDSWTIVDGGIAP
jgi:surface protein